MPTLRDYQRWARKGTTTQRGYGWDHVKKRHAWEPKVRTGQVPCHAAVCLEELEGRGRYIVPGTPWHLGHTADRTGYTGPEHERCNEADGARRGNRQRGLVVTGWRSSRAW